MLAAVVLILGLILLACLFPGFRLLLSAILLILTVWIGTTIHDAPIHAKRAAEHRATCDNYTRVNNTIHPNCTIYH